MNGVGAPGSPAPAELSKPSYAWTSSAFYRCLMLEEEALLASRDALRSAVEFGTILAWFYVADRTSLIAPGTKVGRCCMREAVRCGCLAMCLRARLVEAGSLPSQQHAPATWPSGSWGGCHPSLIAPPPALRGLDCPNKAALMACLQGCSAPAGHAAAPNHARDSAG